MPSVIDTKNRLSSAKSTQKVIKAMELVASSKIKKAREKAQNIRFFYDTTIQAMNTIYSYEEVEKFATNKDSNKTLVFAINSDMGLCGAFNSNINKAVNNLLEEIDDYEVIAAGTKLVNKLKFEKIDTYKSFVQYSSLTEEEFAKEVSDLIIEKIRDKEVKSVKIVYTKFINALTQEVEVLDLLDFENTGEIDSTKTRPTLLVEPDRETVLDQLLEQFVYSIVYTSIIQSLASEHSYRRNAMDSANTNSLELIDKLNLELNRIRQANITQEISEIIGGSEALKKG